VHFTALKQQRYQAAIFSGMAGLALILATLGLYGMIAHAVTERRPRCEFRISPRTLVTACAIIPYSPMWLDQPSPAWPRRWPPDKLLLQGSEMHLLHKMKAVNGSCGR